MPDEPAGFARATGARAPPGAAPIRSGSVDGDGWVAGPGEWAHAASAAARISEVALTRRSISERPLLVAYSCSSSAEGERHALHYRLSIAERRRRGASITPGSTRRDVPVLYRDDRVVQRRGSRNKSRCASYLHPGDYLAAPQPLLLVNRVTL